MNLHFYPSVFQHESRILRITKSLAKAKIFESIEIIAIGDGIQPELETLDNDRTVWRAPLKFFCKNNETTAKILSFFEWSVRILNRYRQKKIKAINCHSLSTLPLGVFFKLWKDSQLIYDTHELETETPGMTGIRKWIGKAIEKIFISFVDETITVSNLIGDWYQKQYQLPNVHVIRNMPEIGESTASKSLRRDLQINEEDFIFLYSGLFAPNRGLELILDTFPHLPSTRHVVFLGYGPLEDQIKEIAQRHTNVHIHPAVENKHLLDYIREADVGLSLIEDRCLSYRYCLPNKIFEYLAAGRPVIISDLPEMSHLLDEQEAGWKVPFHQPSFQELVTKLEREEIALFKRHLEKKSSIFGWHNEEKKLRNVYKNWA